MDMPPKIEDVSGPLGSLVALLWNKDDTLSRKGAVVLAGCALSFLFSDDIHALVNTYTDYQVSKIAIRGFVGLFGVATVNKLLMTIESIDLWSIVRRWAGVSDKPPVQPTRPSGLDEIRSKEKPK